MTSTWQQWPILNINTMLELLFKNSWVEIVFSKRNKLYGAYTLRKMYSRNVSVAFLIATSFFVLAITGPVIYAMVKPEAKDEDDYKIEEVILSEPPPLDEKTPPPPPPPDLPPPPKVAEVKFLPPEVKPDEEVVEDPPTIEDLKDKVISTVDVEGADATGAEIIVEGDGQGDAVTEAPPAIEEPVAFAEEMPTFEGGYAAYLAKNINYPAQASKMSIEGKVWVQFVVEKDGKISNVKVVKGIGYGCDEEAVRVIAAMPSWTPAKTNGRAVRLTMKLPVKYTLQ